MIIISMWSKKRNTKNREGGRSENQDIKCTYNLCFNQNEFSELELHYFGVKLLVFI